MTTLIMITHELVTLEQIISKKIHFHLNNHGIDLAELTIDHHFWSQFALLQTEHKRKHALWRQDIEHALVKLEGAIRRVLVEALDGSVARKRARYMS